LSGIEIDWEQLHDLSGHDPDFERELLQLFLQDSQQQLVQLELAWAESSLNRIRPIAHHIKGAGANVGANAIAQWARQIETAARDQQPVEIQTALKELRSSIEQLKTYLESHLENHMESGNLLESP
jgi:hypothetical protein